MKTKKEILLEFIQDYSNQYQMEEYPQLTTLFLSEKLNMQRTNISTLLNQLVKEGKVKMMEDLFYINWFLMKMKNVILKV